MLSTHTKHATSDCFITRLCMCLHLHRAQSLERQSINQPQPAVESVTASCHAVTQSRSHAVTGSHSRDDLWWSHRCHNNIPFPPCHSLTTPALPCIEIFPNRIKNRPSIRSIKARMMFLFEVKNICVENLKTCSFIMSDNPHNLLRVEVHTSAQIDTRHYTVDT